MIRTPITSISVQDLVVGFDKPIVSGLSFNLKQGDCVSLHGPSGGGKSTLLRTLSGLIEPLSGKIFLNDINLVELSFEEFLPLRLNMGVSFDLGGLLSNRTIWDNMMLPLLYHKIYNFDEAEARADRLASSFGFLKYKNERPASIPGGIRKAACVARALLLDPQIIFMDEPTTGLNNEGIRALDFEMGRLMKRNAIVVFSTRDNEFEKKWANSILKVDSDRSEFSKIGSAA
jgi:ABC-type transporter Mla maintaining outer membrane lipid asymmetry ATPase subunit MlaF